ncbi:hypothetical protein, conserved [Babesia ovata]|uniref:C3H1-type domain-containing protein n=1 Tax=Babesia ovata TaxID=189622 RepID=A0A2H6KKL8_9APIC|nr:uncharacterized protein BOVATA_050260 [Babesia ovata]GBE63533.1 hypothetical protein, conserved [Babesia ovata]
MSFLHGVLKDVHTKQPYNVGKPRLEHLVYNVLQPKLCSGHVGFKFIIRDVTKYVAVYNKSVKKINDERARKPVETWLKNVDESFRNQVGEILKSHEDVSSEVVKAKGQVDAKCRDSIRFTKELLEALKYGEEKFKAISDLNKDCKNNVSDAVKTVEQEFERFSELSTKQKSDLDAMTKKVSETLTKVRDDVNGKIKLDVEELVKLLKEKVKKILEQLKEINATLEQCVRDLDWWSREADGVVEDALKKVDAILAEVASPADKKKKLETTAILLKSSADALHRAGEAAKKNVVAEVTTALEKVLVLDRAVRTGLKQTRDGIEGALKNYVKDQLLGDIKGKVEKIIRGNGGSDGLEQIVKKVKAWAGKFKEEDSLKQNVLEDWIDDILKAEPVKGWLGKYYDATKKGELTTKSKQELLSGEDTALHKPIKQQIITNLSGEIPKTFQALKALDNVEEDSVDESVTAIQVICNTFADEVAEQLKTGTFDAFADKIAREVERLLTGDHSVNPNLNRAVLSTLHQLVGAARKAGEAVHSFTTDDSTMSEHVEAALNVANQLGLDLKQATKPAVLGVSVVPIPTDEQGDHKYSYDGRILGILEAEIGKDDNYGKVTKAHKTHFGDYSGLINQKNPKLKIQDAVLTGNPDEGTFPPVIKKIETSVTGALTDINDFQRDAEKKLEEITSTLKAMCDAIKQATETGQGNLKDKLYELRRRIGKTLRGKENNMQDLYTKLNNLQNTLLHGPITAAEAFIKTYAKAAGERTIGSLTKYVDEKVDYATKQITTQADKQYVTTMKLLLQRFADRVTEQLTPLPKQIEDDKYIGFKGFMLRFEKHFIETIKGIGNISPTSFTPTSPLSQAALKVNIGFNGFLDNLSGQTEINPVAEKVTSVSTSLNKLLQQMINSAHFDHEVTKRREMFDNSLIDFKAETFTDAPKALLFPVKEALTLFSREMSKAYLNVYEGATAIQWDSENNPETTYCAKAFLTTVPILASALGDLKEKLENKPNWNNYKIYNSEKSHHSLHRLFFKEHGYDIDVPVGAKHGELNHKPECNGARILGHLTEGAHKLFDTSDMSHKASDIIPKDTDELTIQLVNEDGVIPKLFAHLSTYFRTCHLEINNAPRPPCNVYEQLVWLNGLLHNPMHSKLEDYIKTYCAKPETQKTKEYSEIDPRDLRLETSSILTAHNVFQIIQHLCDNSHNLLTTILGTGDEHTVYASDFSNNALRLKYPSNPAECLDMLLDILRRLFTVFRFLEGQCGHPASIYGWADCAYGKSVAPANWQCKDHPRGKANEQPNCQAKCQPTCQPKCQPTSPLMSFFTDTLPGHLPHQLTNVGCKTVCSTCPSTSRNGMPCLTPLGFRAFSGSTKTGKDLCRIIDAFLNFYDVSCIFSIVSRPPSSLPEHFSFVLSLVRGWQADSTTLVKNGFQCVFEQSIKDRSIHLYDPPSDLTNALCDAYGSSQSSHDSTKHPTTPPKAKHDELTNADLSSICMAIPCNVADVRCAPYLSALCTDQYSYLSRKHSGTYLSWALYLPWALYDYLECLYKAFEAIFCQDWGCHNCMHGDKCRRGEHGKQDASCQCPSLLACKGVSPTLYRYGFKFGIPWTLCDKESTKKCFDFQTQLHKILHSKHFEKLFAQCDMYLWRTREPFSHLLLALWSLSFLYLLHIAVVRLDVLRIRSHLRSPSSHRIAAQSLLAAAKVKALANVKYFSP